MTTVQNAPAQTQTAVEDVEEKSPLRAALESSIAEVEKQPAEGSQPTPEPKDGETKPLGTKTEEGGEPTPAGAENKTGEAAKEPKQEPADGGDRAPSSWKAPAKAKWASVDPEIKAEVQRREREISREIQRQAPVKQFTEAFTGMIKPYMPRLQAAGAQPMQAIKSLLDVDHVLSSAPMGTRAKMMAKLITDYGIDVAALDEALSGGNPDQNNPASILDARIQQAVAPLQEKLQRFSAREEQEQAQEYQRNQSAIDAMAADKDKYPHFDSVIGDMADLIEVKAAKGVALSLEQAYNLAVKMNPEAQQAEADRLKQQTAQKQNAQAQKALGASLSISGSPAPLRTEVNTSDLRATLEAAMAAHGGR